MSYKRVCRDCPIPDCGAKHLVKLSNHLADVHGLSCDERRKWLQESKLQPVVRVVECKSNNTYKDEQLSFVHQRTKNIGVENREGTQKERQSTECSRKPRWIPLP